VHDAQSLIELELRRYSDNVTLFISPEQLWRRRRVDREQLDSGRDEVIIARLGRSNITESDAASNVFIVELDRSHNYRQENETIVRSKYEISEYEYQRR
jgi:hypothetical protein